MTETNYDGGTPYSNFATESDGTVVYTGETLFDGGSPSTEFSTQDGAIDYASPLGKVRLLILDTADDPADRLFTEAQLNAFLDMNAGSVKRTAAAALVTIATSEVLLSKKIRTQDLSTDGPAVAAELRAQAAVLAGQADTEDAAAAESVFEIIPMYSAYAEAAERP